MGRSQLLESSGMQWCLVLAFPHRQDQRGATPGTLRGSGATFLYSGCEDPAWIAWRGRWSRVRTLEYYLQEVAAQLLIHELSPVSRSKIQILSNAAWHVLASFLSLRGSEWEVDSQMLHSSFSQWDLFQIYSSLAKYLACCLESQCSCLQRTWETWHSQVKEMFFLSLEITCATGTKPLFGPKNPRPPFYSEIELVDSQMLHSSFSQWDLFQIYSSLAKYLACCLESQCSCLQRTWETWHSQVKEIYIYIYTPFLIMGHFFCNHLCCWPSPVGINLEMLLCHTIAWLLIWLVVPWQWVVVFTGSVSPTVRGRTVRRFDSLKLGSPHAPRRHFEIFCRKESWRVGQFSV